MGCNHNFVFVQGHFHCTKCGQKNNERSHKKKQGKKAVGIITVVTIIGIVVILFSNGIVDFNQENIDEAIQNMPQSIQNASKIAQDVVLETSTILRETVNESLETVQIEPDSISVDTIPEIPKKIQESNPINKKPEIDKSELEKQVHILTNQYRTQNGLKILSWDDALSNVARNHSKDMALRNYFSHDTPEGSDPTDRGLSQGYRCQKTIGNVIYSGIAENLFQNNLYDTVWHTGGIPTSYDWNTQNELAHSTVDGWMDSPGHRENILTKTHDREGIGVEISSDAKVYITQNFC